MTTYSINKDVSFVSDHERLVVLNFETGEYYTVGGICKDIIEIIYKNIITREELVSILKKKYNEEEYDIEQSLDAALNELTQCFFINVNEN